MTSDAELGEAPAIPVAAPKTEPPADPGGASPAAEAGSPEVETAPPLSPSTPAPPWARRAFVLRTLGAAGVALAAVVAIPVAGLASALAIRRPLRWPLLAGSIAPTPRSTEFVNLGPLSSFPIGGAPTLLPVTVPVEIGGVTQDARIAVYVERLHDQSVVIMDIHCTHMGCPVGWSEGAKRFLCPCHGGAFTGDGHSESGPPPRPLDRYQAIIANQQVWMGPLVEGA